MSARRVRCGLLLRGRLRAAMSVTSVTSSVYPTELRKRVAEVEAMSPINQRVVVASCFEKKTNKQKNMLRGTPGKSFGSRCL